MNHFFSDIGKAIQESKAYSAAINLPIQVIKYEKISGKDYVTGVNLLTLDQPEPELVKAFLLEDKQAGKRKEARTELAQRQDPAENGYVGVGGIMIMERAYQQKDGSYAANWTVCISPDENRGGAQKCVLSMSFYEAADNTKKPSVIVRWFSPAKAIKVKTEEELKQAMFDATENHITSTTPEVMVRVVFNGEVHAENMVRTRIKDNDYALEPFSDAYERFCNSNVGQAILQAIRGDSENQLMFEVIRGGYGYLPPLQRDRFFVNGKLKDVGQFDQPSEGRILKDLFQPNVGGVHKQYYCEGVLGIKVSKGKANSPAWPFYRYAKPISSQPKMFEMQYMPSPNFQPSETQYRETTMVIHEDQEVENGAALVATPATPAPGFTAANASSSTVVSQQAPEQAPPPPVVDNQIINKINLF